MKKFWLNSLLRVYAMTMFVIVGFVALLISYASWQSKVQEVTETSQRISTRLVDEVESYYQRGVQITKNLVGNQAKLEGVYNYFTMSPSEYIYWRLNNGLLGIVEVSLHENIADIYLQNDFVAGFDIALQDYKTVFVSTRQKQGGMQVEASKYKPAKNAFPIPIYDSVTSNHIGVVYLTIDSQVFEQTIDNIRNTTPVLVKIISPFQKNMLTFGEGKSKNWLVKETPHGYGVQVAVPEHYVLERSVVNAIVIVAISAILTGSLYLILQRVFRNYQRQVIDLVDTIQAIGQGDSHLRIETATKEQELLLIAMRALQAQINPHFMYNTLEFIRMYAVMKSQEELADIIYEFSSLLRNNISDETQVTLESELEFCRKYSYLCMVRHPNSVAYGFTIAEELKGMIIPKFTIQPLVENYFAHGIDYRRKDNVISVKVLKKSDAVQIIVQDNGCGIKADKLAEIQQILAKRQLENSENKEKRTSIGIINIHERFLLFFGDRYSIAVESGENKGVRYIIEIKDE